MNSGNKSTLEYNLACGSDALVSGGRLGYFSLLIVELFLVLGIYISFSGVGWAAATKAGIMAAFVICIVHLCYRLLPLREANFLAPDVLYVLFYMLFHFGYLSLWLFGIVPESDFIFQYDTLFPKTMIIVNLGLIGFIFGYELGAGRKLPDMKSYIFKAPGVLWPVVGLILMIAALMIQLVYIVRVGIDVFILHGYEVFMNMRDYVSDSRLWGLQPQIFAFGFSIYIISVALLHKRLFAGKFGLVLFLIQIGLLMNEGARSALIALGMVLVLVRHYCIKPFKFHTLLIVAISLMALFNAIGIVRSITSFDISRAISELTYASGSGQTHWYDPLVEMGGSVRTVNLTTSLVPEIQPYWHGRSYIQAITHTVPFLQGFAVNHGLSGLGPAEWLTFTLFGYEASGTGFSIAGEGYLNFGLPGAFLQMIFIGWLLRRIYVRFVKNISPGNCMVFFASTGIFLISVRGHTNLIFAPLVQIVLLAFLMKKICGERELLIESEESETAFCVTQNDNPE